jgi:hypothetical protein
MTSNGEWAELFEDAADILDVDGWCQGRSSTPDGRICMGHAIRRAITNRYGWDTNHDVVGAHGPLGFHFPLYPIATYNDERGRTQGEVTDFLRTAAKRLREGT